MSPETLSRPRLREDFRKRLRAELMNEAVALAEERRLSGRSLAQRLRWWGPRLRAVAVVATLVAMLAAGAGAAAASSLPGDPAFGLKRAAEQIQVVLAPTPEARVQVLASQVQERLGDLERSAQVPGKAPTASTAYEDAVQRFAAAVEQLRSSEPGQHHDGVDQAVENARHRDLPVLEDLKDRLPAEAQPGIQRAIDAQEKLAPSRSDDGAPGVVPSQVPERERATDAPRESERPRTTASPRPRETEAPRATATDRTGDRTTENSGD